MGYSYSSSEVNQTIYNCLVTKSFGLQCYPRLLRICGIPLAYSTSNPRVQDANRFSYSVHFIPLSRFILRTISRPSFHSQPKPTVKEQYFKERCSPLRTLFVAETGLEPVTSRLWALRASSCSTPRYEFYISYFLFVLQRYELFLLWPNLFVKIFV